jgi:hypothetical protein
MKECCACCGTSANIDGCINQHGDWVCVDCWYTGDARRDGFVAKSAVPADFFGTYPKHCYDSLLAACKADGAEDPEEENSQ